MNRFFDSPGDVSLQLSPLELEKRGLSPKKRRGFWILFSLFSRWVAQFELREVIRFYSTRAGGVIRVEIGYLSDLASIPWWAWWFMAPDDPRIELGGWVHDLLYGSLGLIVLEDGTRVRLRRRDCDYILAYEAMPALGASRWQCWIVYQALRRFGDGWKGDSWTERFTG